MPSANIILLTFQLLLTVLSCGHTGNGRPISVEDETTTPRTSTTTTTTYCPWPPCYHDSWNLDYAQIPILNETITKTVKSMGAAGVDSKITIKTKEEFGDHHDNPDASFPGTIHIVDIFLIRCINFGEL